MGVGGEGANRDFVGSASSVRSFPDQGHISAVEEKGGRAMMALSPSLSPLLLSLSLSPLFPRNRAADLASAGRSEWMESKRMKGSRRCVFGDLEHSVQAHISSHKQRSHTCDVMHLHHWQHKYD